MTMTALIGHQPAQLEVRLIAGESGEAVWVAKGPDGAPIPWTSAPVLHMPGDVTVTATLAAEGVVADARATWLIGPTQVAAVHAVVGNTSGVAWVTVGGRTMFKGTARVASWA